MKGRRRTLTTEQEDTIYAGHYTLGMRVVDLAARYGVSGGTILRAMNRSAQRGALKQVTPATAIARLDRAPLPPMDDEAICEAVAAALNRDGFTAEAQYTGGNIWCVDIVEPNFPNASWLCGMSCEDWAGTLEYRDSYGVYDDEALGDDDVYIYTEVSSESTDTSSIAAALALAIRQWRAKHPPYRTLLPAAVTGA